MFEKYKLIKIAAWFFALNFVFIFAISHWPGLTDSQGRLLGLFHIDPIDDVFHLLSGIAAVIVALKTPKWCKYYFLTIAFLYGVDAFMGLVFDREFLNPTFITQGLGSPNFSQQAILINLPHILIMLAALILVYVLPITKREIQESN